MVLALAVPSVDSSPMSKPASSFGVAHLLKKRWVDVVRSLTKALHLFPLDRVHDIPHGCASPVTVRVVVRIALFVLLSKLGCAYLFVSRVTGTLHSPRGGQLRPVQIYAFPARRR